MMGYSDLFKWFDYYYFINILKSNYAKSSTTLLVYMMSFSKSVIKPVKRDANFWNWLVQQDSINYKDYEAVSKLRVSIQKDFAL